MTQKLNKQQTAKTKKTKKKQLLSISATPKKVKRWTPLFVGEFDKHLWKPFKACFHNVEPLKLRNQ